MDTTAAFAPTPPAAGGPRLDDVDSPKSLSYRMRTRRDVRLRALIAEVSAENGGKARILDLGGSVEYWRRVGVGFLREKGCHVTVLNYAASELKAQGMEGALFSAEVGDACDLPQFADRSFDLIHSNSVIEHVGDWSRMKAFASEVRRLASRYYVQTPNFWFPVDPHRWRFPMIHWLPASLQARLMTALPITYSGRLPSLDAARSAVDRIVMVGGAEFRWLFPDATISAERFMGLRKSLIAVR